MNILILDKLFLKKALSLYPAELKQSASLLKELPEQAEHSKNKDRL
jgi:hypothetical protein